MSTQSFLLTDELADYLRPLAGQETDIQRRLSEATAKLPEAEMKSSPEAMRMIAMLIRLMGARRAIEVGTFTGYGALTIASALPIGGELICCDLEPQWAAIGRPFWEEAGVADRITLKVGDARQTLRDLIEQKLPPVDFVFIDADKERYPDYYELCLTLVRPGGMLVFDNALRGGAVADPLKQDDGVVAVRRTNARAFVDERVEPAMLLLGDGLLLARKR